jgi:hypothetical protein
MNRLELYKSSPQPPVITDATIGIRNVRLVRFGKLGSSVQGMSLAVVGNPVLTSMGLDILVGANNVSIWNNATLAQCFVDALLTQITGAVSSVTSGGNLDGCTCTIDPVVPTCPELEPDPDPGA